MNADELDPKAVTHKSDFQDPVSVERANFSWEADNVRYYLELLSQELLRFARTYFRMPVCQKASGTTIPAIY